MRLRWVAKVRQSETKILRVVHWDVVGVGNEKEGRKQKAFRIMPAEDSRNLYLSDNQQNKNE